MQAVTSSIHIVRRYSLVGGMEAYVYELTHALSRKNQRVTVLCEVCEAVDIDNNITVVVLGNRFKKPRWLAQWGFLRRVSEYIKANDWEFPEVVLHSHERTAVHHVTTFHGPPFLLRRQRWTDIFSPRIYMWSYLERQELLGEQVKAILPNSGMIADQLAALYPVTEKIQLPAYPGVAEHYASVERQPFSHTIGFLGREWKRKGLDVAIQVVRRLRTHYPSVRFLVAGCLPGEVKDLFESEESGLPDDAYSLLGWVDADYFFSEVDLLLHPARSEPFGMAIAEANAVGIPVVVSDQCGIASLIGDFQGSVCKVDLSVSPPVNYDEWVDACAEWLYSPKSIEPLGLSWDALADQHVQLYQQLSIRN